MRDGGNEEEEVLRLEYNEVRCELRPALPNVVSRTSKVKERRRGSVGQPQGRATSIAGYRAHYKMSKRDFNIQGIEAYD